MRSAQARAKDKKEWLGKGLHDLCQPLTALQCCLFLGTLTSAGEGRAEAMEQAIGDALAQCERAIEQVRAMQLRMYETRTHLEEAR